MDTRSERLGDLLLTIDDLNVVPGGGIICKFRLSHRHEPDETLAELYAELGGDGTLEAVCRTQLTPRRMEIVSRFLHMYEANITRLFRERARGADPYLFRTPMP